MIIRTIILISVYALYVMLFVYTLIAMQEATNEFVEAIWGTATVIIFLAWSFHVRSDMISQPCPDWKEL
jgi:steroid 5-alpha reductase family enzyme